MQEIQERPCGATDEVGEWGGAPPRKPNLQASKLPNFRGAKGAPR